MELLKLSEVSRYLNLKPSQVLNYVEKRNIPHTRINDQVRFPKEDIERWVREKTVKVE